MRATCFLAFFIVSFTAFHSELNAQTAVVRKNIVYLNEQPVFQLQSVGTLAHQAYKIKNMNGEDLILLDQTPLRNNQGTSLIKFVFYAMPEQEAYLPVNVNFKKQLARILANYNVILDGKLNPEGVALFSKNYNLNNYPSKYIASEQNNRREEKPVENLSVEPTPVETRIADTLVEVASEPEPVIEMTTPDPDNADDYPMVKRDHDQQIYLSGNKVRQDYKEIGSFTTEKVTLLSKEGTEITLYAFDGKKVAIARFINGEEFCEVETLRDHKMMNIQIPAADIYTIVKEIVKVLSVKLYI